MGRLLFFGFEGFAGLLLLAVWIWAVFDVITTDEAMLRNLPKGLWILLVLFVPTIGALTWIIAGRPVGVGWRPGDSTYRPPRRRTIGPEDRPDWNRTSEEQRRDFEETDRRLVEERARRRKEAEADRPDRDLRAQQLDEWEADLLRREREMLEQRRDPGAGPGPG